MRFNFGRVEDKCFIALYKKLLRSEMRIDTEHNSKVVNDNI